MRSDMIRRSLFIAACATLAACDLPIIETGGPAYDPTSLTDGLIYHWPTGADVALYVDESNEPADADLMRAVQEAVAAWNSVGVLGEVRLGITSDLRAADVIVHHSTSTPPVATSECEPPSAFGSSYTHFCPSADPTRALVFPLGDGTGGRVKMLVSVNRGVVDSEEIFRAHVAHELGHVLGIGAHSNDSNDLMFGVPRRLTPSAADAQTLRYVLGQRPDIRL